MISLGLVLVSAVSHLRVTVRGARAHATWVLVASALLALGLAFAAVVAPPSGTWLGGYFCVDATTRLFLAVINPIFLGVSVYIHHRVAAAPVLRPQMARFTCLAVTFLVAANTVLVSNHLLVSWIALEVTTLAAAPLIVRPGVAASRLASLRYLLFSSVGLALVFLGLICVARGAESVGQAPAFFIHHAPATAAPAGPWSKLGVALTILGLGTKLGLAPMYTWLPESYDQAPPAVSALLGAVQFNCAAVLLLRILQVYGPAHRELVSFELMAVGVISMTVSTLSIIATHNVKRLIAYAAINHGGVMVIGLALGRDAAYGVLLYIISNAFIKAILFLTVGKIKAHYRTKDTREIAGLIKDLPYSGVFLLVGTLALLGFPPFGSFFGELLILSALVSGGHLLVFSSFCVLITMTFVATGRTIFPMVWGAARRAPTWPRQTFLSTWPKIAFLAVLVALGVYIPPPVNDLIMEVAVSLGQP
jgi:hydrogenase-4 component F